MSTELAKFYVLKMLNRHDQHDTRLYNTAPIAIIDMTACRSQHDLPRSSHRCVRKELFISRAETKAGVGPAESMIPLKHLVDILNESMATRTIESPKSSHNHLPIPQACDLLIPTDPPSQSVL